MSERQGAGRGGTSLLDEEFIALVERLQFVSRKLILGRFKGDRLSRRRGQSMEFADFRPYAPGDDLRFLDWSIYGRLERLFLKVFLEEEDFQVTILVDTSPSMDHGRPSKFRYAKQVAAALGVIGLAGHDKVSVGAVGAGLAPVFGPRRGRGHRLALLRALEELVPAAAGGTDLAAGLRELAARGRAAGIVVLVSDFLDRGGCEPLLRRLSTLGRGVEVFLFHVLSPQEISPPLQGDLKLVDCEDGREVEVTISAPLLRAYRRGLEAFSGELRRQGARRGMHYLFASSDVPFDRLILGYLRRRGFLR